jgi:peroxiredoxin
VACNKAPAGRGLFQNLTALVALGFVLCAPVASASGSDAPQPALTAWTGTAKSPFRLNDLANTAVSLADARAEIVVVHFFATWCEPCRDELPALRRLVERSDPAQLRVISISVAEVGARVRSFVEKLPVNFPILLDSDRAVAKSWSVSTLPTTFILDRDLHPRLFVEREYDWDQVDVPQLLKSIGG